MGRGTAVQILVRLKVSGCFLSNQVTAPVRHNSSDVKQGQKKLSPISDAQKASSCMGMLPILCLCTLHAVVFNSLSTYVPICKDEYCHSKVSLSLTINGTYSGISSWDLSLLSLSIHLMGSEMPQPRPRTILWDSTVART